jgi:hypothetical protein
MILFNSVIITFCSFRNLMISANAFRGILIKPGGRLVVNIKNYNRITFDESSLRSLQLQSTSSFALNIESSGTILFKSKCAKQWTAYQTAALPDSTPSDTVTFRLNMSNVDAVYFEKESFAEMEIDKASTFQIIVNKFNKVSTRFSKFFLSFCVYKYLLI